jgi:hypothetical protein
MLFNKEKKFTGFDLKELNSDSSDEDVGYNARELFNHYDTIKKSKQQWFKLYKAAWMEALKNKEAATYFTDHKKMEASAEYKAHKKDFEDLLKVLGDKKNVKVTGYVPKEYDSDDFSDDDSTDEEKELAVKKAPKKAPAKKAKKAAADASSDDEEELKSKRPAAKKEVAKKTKKAADDSSSDDEEDLIKITVDKAGRKQISKEWNDVEHVWKRIEHSKPVRNLGASLNRWGNSKEISDIKALDKKFMSTPRGKKMAREIGDVFQQLDKSVYHNKAGLQINNNELVHIDDELNDVEAEFKSFKKSKWQRMYEEKWEAAFKNKQAHSVHRRMKEFKKSPQAAALKKEMREFKVSLKKNVKVTDIPKNFAEEDNLYLF